MQQISHLGWFTLIFIIPLLLFEKVFFRQVQVLFGYVIALNVVRTILNPVL